MLPAGRNNGEAASQFAAQGSSDIVLTYAVQPMFEDDVEAAAQPGDAAGV
jgi:hypothetical protein